MIFFCFSKMLEARINCLDKADFVLYKKILIFMLLLNIFI